MPLHRWRNFVLLQQCSIVSIYRFDFFVLLSFVLLYYLRQFLLAELHCFIANAIFIAIVIIIIIVVVAVVVVVCD